MIDHITTASDGQLGHQMQHLIKQWSHVGGADVAFEIQAVNCAFSSDTDTTLATIVDRDFTIFNVDKQKFEKHEWDTCNIVDITH